VTKVSRADGSFTAEERIKQYYYHGDHLGSAQMISDAVGEEYERIEYTPYGELWIEKASAASNIDIPYRFTGKERDAETGLYYYGARYLDSKTGRWLSTDPALGDYVPGAPVDDEARKRNQSLPGMGGVFNTVNMHLYHYAGNNPVKYTDPDGRNDENAYQEIQNNKYFLIVSINLPGKESTQDTVMPSKITPQENKLGSGPDGGHAFVTLVHIDLKNKDITSDSFGLYPAEGGYMFGADVTGKVVDDSKSYADTKYAVPITKEGYQAALDYGKSTVSNPPVYNLQNNNCVDYVIQMGDKAGTRLPDRGAFFNGAGWLSNPSQLNRSMRFKERFNIK
jgi:RHS repeat-associated protein